MTSYQESTKNNKIENEPSSVGVFRGTTIIRRKIDHESPRPTSGTAAHSSFILDNIIESTVPNLNIKHADDSSADHKAILIPAITNKSGECYETPPEEVIANSFQPIVISSPPVPHTLSINAISEIANLPSQDSESYGLTDKPIVSNINNMASNSITSSTSAVLTAGTSTCTKTKPARFVVVRFQEYTNRWIHKHVSCKDKFMMERPAWLAENSLRFGAVSSGLIESSLENFSSHQSNCHSQVPFLCIVPPNMALLGGNDYTHQTRCLHSVKACRRRDNLTTSAISNDSISSSALTIGSNSVNVSVNTVPSSIYGSSIASVVPISNSNRSSTSQSNPSTSIVGRTNLMTGLVASTSRFDNVITEEFVNSATVCSSHTSAGGSPSRTRRLRGTRIDHIGSEDRDTSGDSVSSGSQIKGTKNGGTPRRRRAFQEFQHSMTEGDAEAIINNLISDTTPESNQSSLINPPVSPAIGDVRSRHNSLDFIESSAACVIAPSIFANVVAQPISATEGAAPVMENSAVFADSEALKSVPLPMTAVTPLPQCTVSRAHSVLLEPLQIVSNAPHVSACRVDSTTQPSSIDNQSLLYASGLHFSTSHDINSHETVSSLPQPHVQPMTAEVMPLSSLPQSFSVFNDSSILSTTSLLRAPPFLRSSGGPAQDWHAMEQRVDARIAGMTDMIRGAIVSTIRAEIDPWNQRMWQYVNQLQSEMLTLSNTLRQYAPEEVYQEAIGRQAAIGSLNTAVSGGLLHNGGGLPMNSVHHPILSNRTFSNNANGSSVASSSCLLDSMNVNGSISQHRAL